MAMETEAPSSQFTETDTNIFSSNYRLNEKTQDLFDEYSKSLKAWKSNLDAAVANVAITVPVTLAQIAMINEYTAEKQQISYVYGFLSLFVSYLFSFLLNGGSMLYKALSQIQAFIIMIQIQAYGLDGLRYTCVGAGLFLILLVVLRVHRITEILPNCILLGFQFSMGIFYILNELVNIMGVASKRMHGMLLYRLSTQIKINMDYNHYILLGSTLFFVIVLQILLKKKPSWPWHSLFFLTALIVGFILGDRIPKEGSVLSSKWPNQELLLNHAEDQPKHPLYGKLLNSTLLLEPYFILNVMTLALLTLLESSISMRLVKVMFEKPTKKRFELFGIGFINVVNGLLGLMPVSIPVCRNVLMHKLKVSSTVYCLLSALLVILFCWALAPVFHCIPMLIVSVFNISLGLSMIDLNVIYNYWKYNRRYGLILLIIVLSSFFVHIIFSMIVSWILFFGVYFNRVKEEPFSLGLYKEMKARLDRFNIKNSKKYKDDEAACRLIAGNSRQEEIMRRLKLQGTIYQLKGRFNFLHSQAHIQNMLLLKGRTILLDFTGIFYHDWEFIRNYRPLIVELKDRGIDFYVCGIPKDIVGDDKLLRASWIEELDEEDRLLFIN